MTYEVTRHFVDRCHDRGVSIGQIDLIVSALKGGTSAPVARGGNCRDFHRVTLPDSSSYYIVVSAETKDLITIYTETMFHSHWNHSYDKDDGKTLYISSNAWQAAIKQGIHNDILMTGLRAVTLAVRGDDTYAEFVCKGRNCKERGNTNYYRVKFDSDNIYYLVANNGCVVTVETQSMFSRKRKNRKSWK